MSKSCAQHGSMKTLKTLIFQKMKKKNEKKKKIKKKMKKKWLDENEIENNDDYVKKFYFVQ